MIEINIKNETTCDLTLYYKTFYKIADYLLKKFNIKSKTEFSVTFVSKNTIQEVNKTYRKIDRVTDVISFENDDDFVVIDGYLTLGDIFICPFKAKQQAKLYQHSFEREIYFLFTHGLLHILKMDHQNEEEREAMFKIQDEVLNHFKIYR